MVTKKILFTCLMLINLDLVHAKQKISSPIESISFYTYDQVSKKTYDKVLKTGILVSQYSFLKGIPHLIPDYINIPLFLKTKTVIIAQKGDTFYLIAGTTDKKTAKDMLERYLEKRSLLDNFVKQLSQNKLTEGTSDCFL